MKITGSCRDARHAHEMIEKRYRRDYCSLEGRDGKLRFYSPAQAMGNGPENCVGVFDPARRTLTFMPTSR